MSELERSETGALTESPTLLPTHPEPGGAGAASPTPTTEPKEPAPGAGEPTSNGATDNGSTGNEASSGTTTDGAPKKRRRRGSRGGRGRKKPGTGAAEGRAANGGNANGGAPADEPDAMEGSEDWTSAEADRGLTDDDIAEQARDDAGLAPAPAPAAPRRDTPAKPRVGDSRPGTPPPASGPAEAPKKRRRRRGGRGRGKGGSGVAPTETQGGGRPKRTEAGVRYVDAGAQLGGVDVDGTALLESLDSVTLARRSGSHRKGRPAGRYLMVVHHRDDGIAHLAVLEGRTLVEHYVSMPTDDTLSIDGNIYLGRVQNVLPGMEAAFIDIGTPKNGVLYHGDVAFDESEVDGGEKPRIERVLRNGQAIIVQVTKNPIGHKGARLTQEVSLAGRFLVMVPGEPDTYGISKRLPDDERKRLRKVLDGIRPTDAGLIVRTAAEGATTDELERDVRRLRHQWEQISDLASKAKQAKLLYQEPDLVMRRIREEFTKEYRGIVIDDRVLYEEIRGYVEAITPELADRVEFYDAEEEGLPIFERFHISEQLLKALDRKVWLPSGGSLIIERTEALTVIDVNTGKNVGKSNLEETVFRNNLEAAEEVARQLRLRDIGGIIVIDFVDIEIKKKRDQGMKGFRDALARDKTRTQAFEMSELGLVEMTRKRISEGLVESFSSTCPSCQGRGFVLDEALLQSMD